jgi:hypothetical protein
MWFLKEPKQLVADKVVLFAEAAKEIHHKHQNH